MTLGSLIDQLKARPQDQPVVFEFGRMQPTSINSYRGYYDQLALGFEMPSWDAKDATVATLLGLCQDVDGKVLEGYKGGDYLMGRDTEVWVANWGETCSTWLVGVTGDDYETRLITAYRGL